VSFQIVEEIPRLIYEGSENKTILDLPYLSRKFQELNWRFWKHNKMPSAL
jgi:hypothetical protein